MITSLHHASFTVEDLGRSIPFYRDVMGLELEGIWERDQEYSENITGIKDARVKVAYFKLGNAFLELVQYLEGKGNKIDSSTNNTGSAHVCFLVDDFTFFTENLRKNGVVFAGKICDGPGEAYKGRKILYIEDTDNNTLELISSV